MNETIQKIELFKKRDELKRKIATIIEEKDLKENKDVEALKEYKEFIKIENELKNLFN